MAGNLPHLYRSLEKSGINARYDAIAMAAAFSFAASKRPGAKQSEALAGLIDPLWSKLSPTTRIEIARRLSAAPNVPARLIERVRSEMTGASAETHSAKTRSPSQGEAGAVAKPSPKRPALFASSAEDARAKLRMLALGSGSPRPASVQATLGRRLVTAAQLRNIEALTTILADALPDARNDLRFMIENADAQALSVALKALGLSTPDAMTVLIFVAEDLARDVSLFAETKLAYDALSMDDSRRAFGIAQRLEVTAPSLAPLSADLQTPIRDTGPRRSAFGRRSSQSDGKGRRSA